MLAKAHNVSASVCSHTFLTVLSTAWEQSLASSCRVRCVDYYPAGVQEFAECNGMCAAGVM